MTDSNRSSSVIIKHTITNCFNKNRKNSETLEKLVGISLYTDVLFHSPNTKGKKKQKKRKPMAAVGGGGFFGGELKTKEFRLFIIFRPSRFLFVLSLLCLSLPWLMRPQHFFFVFFFLRWWRLLYANGVSEATAVFLMRSPRVSFFFLRSRIIGCHPSRHWIHVRWPDTSTSIDTTTWKSI